MPDIQSIKKRIEAFIGNNPQKFKVWGIYTFPENTDYPKWAELEVKNRGRKTWYEVFCNVFKREVGEQFLLNRLGVFLIADEQGLIIDKGHRTVAPTNKDSIVCSLGDCVIPPGNPKDKSHHVWNNYLSRGQKVQIILVNCFNPQDVQPLKDIVGIKR